MTEVIEEQPYNHGVGYHHAQNKQQLLKDKREILLGQWELSARNFMVSNFDF